MKVKRKGTKAERDLLDKFWRLGIGAVRVAGSGASAHPSTDIIAGFRGRIAVIEVKVSSKEAVYIPPEEVRSINSLASVIGAEPWVAVKFTSERRGNFYMLKIDDARELKSGYLTIDLDLARSKGISVEEFARRIMA
ncbi:Holliday junction resolvase [Candidatus Korarchaeum cryptofilum]|jgi:Holliday junction resolvase|uniref:Crossover junction endodeoxyribonuclease Hjc n=1 Tax=Candidatus Korarchaeum cryptofilum TaxID=498846 RepID=A0A429G8G3_9CREN|nr:Holliday junction resolvase Hjc [Candidatus Korarchaeum cryptofilum]RSN70076.1 Holliday junction resolvase [Candidatus Korarchaeum cryptofilum]